MKRIVGLATFLTGSALLASTALAADVLPIVVATPPVVLAPVVTSLAGYVEVYGGLVTYREYDEPGNLDDLERGPMFGGAGRVAYDFSPSFGIQVDAWSQIVHYNDYEEVDGEWVRSGDEYTMALSGLAGHLLFGGTGGLQFGGMISVGGEGSEGLYGNVAAELAAAFGNLRLVGQAGYVFGLASYPADDGVRVPYVRAAATYYINPNFSVSANAGWSRFAVEVEPDFVENTLTFGARTEYGFGATPISIFATYQGYRETEPNDVDIETEHRFGLGVRFRFGAETLQDLDTRVGFGDLNPVYGDDNAAH